MAQRDRDQQQAVELARHAVETSQWQPSALLGSPDGWRLGKINGNPKPKRCSTHEVALSWNLNGAGRRRRRISISGEELSQFARIAATSGKIDARDSRQARATRAGPEQIDRLASDQALRRTPTAANAMAVQSSELGAGIAGQIASRSSISMHPQSSSALCGSRVRSFRFRPQAADDAIA